VVHVTGRLELMLHDKGGGLWEAERGEGSTYTYDVSISDCAPDAHLGGVVESGIGAVEPDWHIALMNAQETDVGDAPDLGMDVRVFDEWEVACTYGGQTSPPSAVSVPAAFPGCTEDFRVKFRNDGNGRWSVGCDVAVPFWTGHIAGELHPIEGPPSA
jgi:hypothetical protein